MPLFHMPRYNLDKLKEKVRYSPQDYKKSREWFAEQAKKLGGMVSQNSLMSSANQLRGRFIPGKMYMYEYYPIGVKTLPYYDIFPLVIPFSADENTFTGLNFHYLPYKVRFVLLKNLLDFSNSQKLDERTRLRLSWEYVAGISRYRGVSSAVKKYRFDRVQTQFLEIPGDQWFMSLLLPVEKFNTGTGMFYMDKNYVWQQSMKYL